MEAGSSFAVNAGSRDAVVFSGRECCHMGSPGEVFSDLHSALNDEVGAG